MAYIEAELAALAAGAEKQRRKALRTCPVVGATICSLQQSSAEVRGGHTQRGNWVSLAVGALYVPWSRP